jgi:hypothetical protein
MMKVKSAKATTKDQTSSRRVGAPMNGGGFMLVDSFGEKVKTVLEFVDVGIADVDAGRDLICNLAIGKGDTRRFHGGEKVGGVCIRQESEDLFSCR